MSNSNFFLKEQLEVLKEKGLLRKMLILNSPQDTYVVINKKRLLNLCSNNYLGLANDVRLKKAAIKAIEKYGVGSGASRLICGSFKLHKLLEEEIAKFKQTESALVFNSGYNANLGIIQSLVGKDDVAFSDKFNHASIVDGIILSRAKLFRYNHNDISHLEELLSREAKNFKKKLIVSDTVFSMDGDIAAVSKLLELAEKYDCLLMLDEAHATGVLGENGKGALEYFGIKPNNRIIEMGTLSKAMGCFGAYTCGSKDLIDFLVNKARSFIYTTALPTGIIAAALEGLKIIQGEKDRRQKLQQNTDFFKDGLRNLGFDIGNSKTQIIPIMLKDSRLTMEFSERLFKEGILVQGIRPPTVPAGEARLRITTMATHTKKDLEFALEKFKKIEKTKKEAYVKRYQQ